MLVATTLVLPSPHAASLVLDTQGSVEPSICPFREWPSIPAAIPWGLKLQLPNRLYSGVPEAPYK